MKHAALRPGLVFDLARVTIEFTTPCLVSSGDGDGLYDAVFVADANGLPALPGETLAGVLRHALADGKNPDEDPLCRLVFGYQQRDQGEASALRVSWAQVHGADDRPVPFRGDAAKLAADPVLALLRRGVARDHVRIGPHGAVDGRGKFDEQLVPAGARFTSELVFDRAAETDAAPLPTLEALMAVLARPELRLGRSGRRGLGGQPGQKQQEGLPNGPRQLGRSPAGSGHGHCRRG